MTLDEVVRYHQETKHHFNRYARSLGHLDWANQPDPFRRYAGSALIALPRLKAGDAPPYEDLFHPGAIASEPATDRTISRFFEHSLAITAWKQAGEVRWALRANPSSGNLHPTEGYLLIDGIAGFSTEPGLYHYAAKEHALELRAQWPQEKITALLKAFPPHAFLVGFSSVIWREAWKYGERAFRYCQHDVGHAIGSARIAARTLGWRMLLLDGTSDDTVAALLGLDRPGDFESAEREHPDCLAVVWPADQAAGIAKGMPHQIPLSLSMDAARDLAQLTWHGKANRLSRGDPVHWENIDRAEAATWKSSTEERLVDLTQHESSAPPSVGSSDRALSAYPGQPNAGQIIRQRRSALAFDGETAISSASFFAMLARVMPRADRDLCKRPMPWDVLPWEPAIHLALFVHRVDGLAPGVYLLVRDLRATDPLRRATHPHYVWTPPPGCPEDLPLYLLEEGNARKMAAQLSCHQDIAADGAFLLGMIAEFDASLARHGPWFYRRLFWETGVIGQVLYLEAEAWGVRATGIGCFFDDPVHRAIGIQDTAFQSLYHFTVGGPVEDPRLTTLAPYDYDG